MNEINNDCFMSKLDCRMNFMLTIDTKKRLKEIARQEETTVSDVMRTFIDKGVAEYGR